MNLRNIAAALAFGILLTGCASSQYIKDDDATKIYQISYDEMFILVPQAVDVAGMKMKASDKDQGTVIAMSPPSFWTSSLANMIAGGDEVTVKITKMEQDRSKVFIRVVATANAMDLGRSARVVETLFKSLDNIVDQRIKAKGGAAAGAAATSAASATAS